MSARTLENIGVGISNIVEGKDFTEGTTSPAGDMMETMKMFENAIYDVLTAILSPIFTISNASWTGGLSNVLENAFNGLVNLERHEIKDKMDTFLKEILNVILLPLYLIRLFISVIRLQPIIDILVALAVLTSLIGASVPALLLIGYAPQYLYRLSSKTFFALL